MGREIGARIRGSPHGGCVKPWSRPPQPDRVSSLIVRSLIRAPGGAGAGAGRRHERRPRR